MSVLSFRDVRSNTPSPAATGNKGWAGKDVAYFFTFFRHKKVNPVSAAPSRGTHPFFEHFQETYELSGKLEQQNNRSRDSAFLRLMEGAKGKKILDAGCAEGLLAVALAEKGHSVTAIDISKTNLVAARARADRKGVPLETLHCDIERNPALLGEKVFDTIYFMDVIEHLADPGRALVNLRNAMKDGGTLFLATPNSNSLVRILLHVANGRRIPDNTIPGVLRNLHLHIYDFITLNQVLNFAGFRVEKLVPTRLYIPFLTPKLGDKGIAIGDWLAKMLPAFSHDLLVVCKKTEPLDVEPLIANWRQFNKE